MEPRRIASYTLLEPIGHGGMAVVYRARQDSLDRTVAIKVLSENLAANEEFIERFRREARTAANMRHPNVITVHDYGLDERGVPYLVLEFIEGETLAELMDVGLDDVRVPELVDQIAAGLDYAHSRGVIHRDIKPGNVLLTEDGRAVLADFGLVWLMEGTHLTMAGGVVGTPEYMSPEQASGTGIDHRSDVYALGVVLYEMLVGERPFTSDTPLGVLLKHLQEPAPSILETRPDLPVAVNDVLQKALAKSPDERFSSAGELARALRAALASAPITLVSIPPLLELAEPPTLTEVEPISQGRACPGCGAMIPAGAGICPACTYMIPLDQLPRVVGPRKLKRRQIVVNLLPYGIRWDPPGLATARRMAADALRQVAVDGWEPASIGEPCQLIEGRTITGLVVRSAVLTLELVT